MRFTGALAFLICALKSGSVWSELPPGFERTVLAEGLCQSSSIVVTTDGRVFVGQVEGVVRVIQDDVLLPGPLIQLETDSDNEQGLCGMVLDPDFDLNGYIYFYYTHIVEGRNRVSRYTVVGNVSDPATELTLWENEPSFTTSHQGGGLAFGVDGTLYVATGDSGASATSQLPSSYNGKVLRLNTDGTVPADNPFLGVPGYEPELWAVGLRNPFRLSYDDLEEELWIGDVGSSGGMAWEEINVGVPGADYGWDDGEGGSCYVPDCSDHEPAVHSYRHDDPSYATSSLNACVILGPRYRGGAFPNEYDGSLFYGDWSGKWIRRLVMNASGDIVDDVVFDSAPDAGDLGAITVGPDGALYCVAVGVPWCIPADSGYVYRVEWVGIPPVVISGADITAGAEPLTVQFSSAGTNDPDDSPGPLTFMWSFGDGSSSSDPNPSHTYTVAGQYNAVLTVSDGQSVVSAAAISITVGDPPELSRGDCNGDMLFDIADVVFHLDALFGLSGLPSCDDACDTNDDGVLDIADPILGLSALFDGGMSLPAPFPSCGVDPGLDGLGCIVPTCP